MNRHLTTKQAYLVMFQFFDAYYWRTKSDNMGTLLGGMSLLDDGDTADPAMWEDWLIALKVAGFPEGMQLDERQAYLAAFRFLDAYHSLTKADNLWTDGIGFLLGRMKLLDTGDPVDPTIWSDWLDAVTAATEENARLRLLKE